jgi:UDP-glucose 4-epimerase
MKYLVTGGAGFIANHLIRELLSQGNSVVILDDLSTGKQQNVDELAALGTVVFYEQKVEAPVEVLFEKEKLDGVFHMAAIPRVQYSIAEPLESHNSNINGTLNILEAAKKYGVKRVVFSSSCSVYGDQKKMPLQETQTTYPLSPYALHKLVGEHYMRLYHLLYSLETVSLRYFNVYGPNQDPNGAYASLIPRFLDQLQKGETPVINGDGTQTRDFVYVQDVVRANILAMQNPNKDILGKVYNIGTGEEVSVNDVSEQIVAIMKTPLRPKHGPGVVEMTKVRADNSLAKEVLGWEPTVRFKDGIVKTVQAFLES